MKKLLALLFLLCAVQVESADRYFSSSGVGTTCSEGSPCSLLTAVVGAVAGDSIIGRTGSYAPLSVHPASGSGSTYTLIKNYPGEVVTFQGTWPPYYSSATHHVGIQATAVSGGAGIVIDNNNTSDEGIFCDNGAGTLLFDGVEVKNSRRQGIFFASGCLPSVVQNFSAHNNGTHYQLDHGVYVESAGHVFANGKIYANSCYGVQIYNGASPTANGNVLKRLWVYGNGVNAANGGHPTIFGSCGGVTMGRGSNNQILDSLIENNIINSDGIVANNGCVDCLIYNSTVRGNSGAVAGINVSSGATRTTVKNNALSLNGTNYANSGSSTTASNNGCTITGGTTGCSVTAASLGLNSDGTLAAGSVLIDAGIASIAPCPQPLNCTQTARSNGPAPDIGAFESIPFASVAAIDSSTIDITYGSAYAPLLTLSSCTNVTVRQAGVAKTCTGFANNGNATYRWTGSGLSAGGGTIDISIAAGKFTDSINVGGSLNQANFALSNQTVTNNISGTSEVFTSRHFRQRTWGRGTTDNSDPAWLKAEDVAGTVRVDGGRLSNWWLIDCTAADCPSVGFQFEFNYNAGSYANVTDSCTTNQLCYDSTNSAAMHGTAIPNCFLTNSLGNCLAGAVAAQASSYPILDLALNQAAPIQANFAIQSGLAVGDTLCVRPKLDSGTAVTHAQTACFTVANPAGSPS